MMADTTSQNAIEFRHVALSFDNTTALTDVSFVLRRGEMIFLTGESGAGKSVLLQLAMGLLKPDSGQIFIGGVEIEALDESALLAIRGGLMGMVFQEDSLFTGISVYDNAAYRLEEHGWTEEKIQTAVTEVLKFVGLDGEEEKLPDELSGGMKRRLEIARALIGWPSIMLFDEPTMGLDPIVAVQVLDLLIRARDVYQISSLLVTKKLHEFPYLTNYQALNEDEGKVVICEAPPDSLPKTRIIMLESGRIAFTGSLAEFQACDLPAAKRLLALDQRDHSADPYFADPWDKKRRAKEEIL